MVDFGEQCNDPLCSTEVTKVYQLNNCTGQS
jgi:hypothetical protein